MKKLGSWALLALLLVPAMAMAGSVKTTATCSCPSCPGCPDCPGGGK